MMWGDDQLAIAGDGRESADAHVLNLALQVLRPCQGLVDRPHDALAQRELLAAFSLQYPLFGNPAEGRTALIRRLLGQASLEAETARGRLKKGVTGQRTTDAFIFTLKELRTTVGVLIQALRSGA